MFGKQASAPLVSNFVISGNVISKSNSNINNLPISVRYYTDTSLKLQTLYFIGKTTATDKLGTFNVKDTFDFNEFSMIQIMIDSSVLSVFFSLDSAQKTETLGERADCSNSGTATHETYTFTPVTINIP